VDVIVANLIKLAYPVKKHACPAFPGAGSAPGPVLGIRRSVSAKPGRKELALGVAAFQSERRLVSRGGDLVAGPSDAGPEGLPATGIWGRLQSFFPRGGVF